MSSVNRITILGRIGKDPELKTMTNGNKVANFSVATNKKWKDKASGETKEKVTWHSIVIWGALADVAARYLKKGDNVYLEGEMDNRSYEKDGVTKYISEVNVSQMVMLGGKSSGQAGPTHGEAAWDPDEGPKPAPLGNTPKPGGDDPFGDLPF
jgi:single-strand DNA-binding protein